MQQAEQEIQQSFEYIGGDLEALSDLVNYQNWILEKFSPYISGDVLEIGAGIGTFSELLLSKCESLTAIEPDAQQYQTLNNVLSKAEQATAYHGLVEAYVAENKGRKFDTIVMINVLEHIEDDNETLRQLHSMLNGGGHLLIFVPALNWLYSPIDKMVGHFRRYHLKPMRLQAVNAGFELKDSRYFDVAGVFPWWLLNVVMKKTNFDPRMAKIYDRFFVPVTKLFESIVPPPLGKNVLMIMKKKDK